MTDYRVYKLNQSGKISGPPEILICEDDETAKKLAELMVDGHAIELWQEARKIARLDPQK